MGCAYCESAQYTIFHTFDANSYELFFRIFGGKEAEPHEFPFIARMNTRKGNSGAFGVCGGSIISDRWIITGRFFIL